MPDIETFEKISDLFKQLGDPTRMRIFWILCHHEECVIPVSYTHLDVYKRQSKICLKN